MPQENTNPLPPEVQKMLTEQLRDVHLPDAISWWPLAWGWWVILAILFLSIAASLFFFYHKRAKNRYRSLAINSLEASYNSWTKKQNNQTYLHQANDVLKRCVLHTSGKAALATLSGKAWVEHLNRQGKKPLSEKAQNALSVECYQANSSSDINTLHNELVYWLKTHVNYADNKHLENMATPTTPVKRGQHA